MRCLSCLCLALPTLNHELSTDIELQKYREQLEALAQKTSVETRAGAPDVRSIEVEKRELHMALSLRLQEIDKLSSMYSARVYSSSSLRAHSVLVPSEESDAYRQQLEEQRAELRSAYDLKTDLESQAMHHKLTISDKDQELFQIKKQNDWLNEELTKKIQEAHQYRQEKTQKLSAMQTNLDVVIQEKSSLESRNRSLQQRVEGLELSVKGFMQKVEEVCLQR